MKWFFIAGMLLISFPVAAQNVAVVKSDSALVYARPDLFSPVLGTLYYGNRINYGPSEKGWAALDSGFVQAHHLITEAGFLEATGLSLNTPSQFQVLRAPNELTQEELLIALLSEQRSYHERDLKIKKTKNVILGIATVTAIVYVVRYLVLVSDL